ncbi:alpha/beta fold hydrolase [Roseomonas marmotae]|uniref:Alpha/beta hydrolase n=1 Tax=Roseomonas marmotae TaxID=2768161 RepID=A0ABS3K8G4_9PROT|nr:alpha/beta hydrolase [Roseomonas marmotae]QTI78640.1 alpha/beta hydrolase [Roseomonas marmotae]
MLFKVVTPYGSIAVEDHRGNGTPILLIHGNSSCRGVFLRQTQSTLAESHRLIAIDLPGHGQSDDAPDPVNGYTRPGLADSIIELLTVLDIGEVIRMGWSLGGHIGIEMLSRFNGVKGLIITGTPPDRHGGMAEGFVALPQTGLAGRRDLSEAEIDDFARMMFGEPVEPFLRDAIRRADGHCRQRLFEAARAGYGVDQRLALENTSVPVAVINGDGDPLIKLDYIDGAAHARLWQGRCHRLSGVGHAAFWHAADEFNSMLFRFARNVESKAV